MAFTLFKILFSAGMIAFSSWLAGKRPELAGFLIALPLMTLLVLPFNYAEFSDPKNTVLFAKSILFAVPLTMTFFIPFLLADKINIGFWGLYGLGLLCLTGSYFAHRLITANFS